MKAVEYNAPPDSVTDVSKLSRRKRLAFSAIAVFLSLGLALTCAEIFLRVWVNYVFEAQSDSPLIASDIPDLIYRLAPNQKSEFVETDQYGLRKRVGPEEVDHRILVIGDSVAFASHTRYESSFVPLLERFLNERMGATVGIWNAAVPGYETIQEAVQLDLVLPVVRPELVVLEYCLNDYLGPLRLTPGGQLDATLQTGNSRRSILGLLGQSRTFLLLKEKVKDLQRARPEWFPTWTHYIHYIPDKEGWRSSEQALLRMRDSLRKARARFVVVVFPVEQQLHIRERRAQDELMKFATKNDIEVLDLYPALEARWRERLYVDYFGFSADKLHLNERGHRIVADQIGAFLLDHRADFFQTEGTNR